MTGREWRMMFGCWIIALLASLVTSAIMDWLSS